MKTCAYPGNIQSSTRGSIERDALDHVRNEQRPLERPGRIPRTGLDRDFTSCEPGPSEPENSSKTSCIVDCCICIEDVAAQQHS